MDGVIDFRIVLPFTMEQCEHSEQYMTAKRIAEESAAGQGGVETLVNDISVDQNDDHESRLASQPPRSSSLESRWMVGGRR
jgi:hypothetical protein